MINENLELLNEYVLKGEQCINNDQMELAANWFLAAEGCLPEGSRLLDILYWEQKMSLRLIGDYYFRKSIEDNNSVHYMILSREWYQRCYDEKDYPGMDSVYMGGVWLSLKDEEEAYRCFINAIRLGNPIAFCELAWLYAEGRGVEKDLHKAEGLLVRAYYEGVKRSVEDLREFCLKGYGSEIARTVVETYYSEKSKEDQNAALALAEWYENGIIVPQDYSKALQYYIQALEFGSSDDLLFRIGSFYQNGLGAEQNYEKAIYYYSKELKEEAWAYPKCDNALGECFFYGYGVGQNASNAIAHCQRAAHHGSIEAMYNVGFLYENGYGVSKDVLKAKEYYTKAAEQGYELAQQALARLQDQIDREAAIETTIETAIINKHMKIIQSKEPREFQLGNHIFVDEEPKYLAISKEFAERNLSSFALQYADRTETDYLYLWGRTSFIVVYEMPALFNVHFAEVLRYLVNYCLPYMKENDIHDGNIYTKYMKNYEKQINEC